MKKYFCNCCGYHFESNKKEIDIFCPYCGAWDVYPDTEEGASQSVKDQFQYEEDLRLWE